MSGFYRICRKELAGRLLSGEADTPPAQHP